MREVSILSIVIWFLFMNHCSGQAPGESSVFNVEEAYIDGTSLNFRIGIKAKQDTILIFKPTLDAVRLGMLFITAKSERGEEFEIYPFQSEYDIDRVSLTLENSVYLLPREYFQTNIVVKLDELENKIEEGVYTIELSFNYSQIQFDIPRDMDPMNASIPIESHFISLSSKK